MAKTSQGARRAAGLTAGAVAVLGLLTACGGGDDPAGPARTVSGPPATGDATTASPSPSATGTATEGETDTPATADGGRCRTSELSASVGRDNPGAGQQNFPLVLTNTSGRTCTLRGYPGAAFLDAAGRQLGPDPKRSAGTAETVTLAPGKSAWAGLSFAAPRISGARAATPASLLVTPPDERDPLKVAWKAGEIPVSGNESSVRLIPFGPGTGA
ncbi:DUF4232 domain-containing protein [Streptomyces sp. ALI-76-A]|jgi:hypothetical protein|uniref:DUF4232 domain-containing protein n=1 Tax=Streptomyces sp. ALI-76-A TaxID=3025736 RepID=UPI00256F4A64|nr:DUF4232 domain-containing protein [Streptomyces sp. ALI-76-A]MDL5205532.1 DUF4232 domain-containing protein [Streptomyces sp. ALI-76-A]